MNTRLRSGLVALALALVPSLASKAQTVVHTWMGSFTAPGAPNTDFNNPLNWAPIPPATTGVVPPSSTNTVLQFGPSANTQTVTLPTGSRTINHIDLRYYSYYTVNSSGAATLTIQPSTTEGLRLVDAGYAPGITFGPTVTLDLPVAQTWSVPYVTVNGTITAAGKLTFLPSIGSGELILSGANTFTGGLDVRSSSLVLNHASALAGGPISLENVTLKLGANITLSQPLTLANNFSTQNKYDAGNVPPFSFTANGTTTLGATLVSVSNWANPITFGGSILETIPGSVLRLISGSTLISGNNNVANAWTGGTQIFEYGRVVFGAANSVPATGQISSTSAYTYVGARFNTTVQSAFLSKIATGFTGTIGFDSPTPASPLSIDGQALDVSGFTNFAGLGSSSAATIGATSTLTIGAAQNYKFGGGSGTLFVGAPLTNTINPAAKVQVGVGIFNSDFNPLTVVLRGNNTFTGGVEIGHGGIIFDGANSLPAANTLTFTGSYYGYAGFTPALGVTMDTFLSRFSTGTLYNHATVGFDSFTGPLTIATNIDLSRGGTLTSPYYLGTATNVTLSGVLTPAGSELRLRGFKAGQLTVSGNLGASPGLTHLVIGDYYDNGTVILSGTNVYDPTFTGTELRGGTLLLGHSLALGNRPLFVTGEDTTLGATTSLSIRNPILLDYYNDELNVGLPTSSANLTLNGFVGTQDPDYYYADARLRYQGAGTLTLAGNYALARLTVDAPATGNVLVTGFGRAGYYGAGPELSITSGVLTFASRRPVVASIGGGPNGRLVLNAGTMLTVTDDNTDSFAGVISGGGAINFVMPTWATATLSGNNTYSGGTTIGAFSSNFEYSSDGLSNGRLALGHNNALGTGSLTILGGGGMLLTTVPNLTIPNAISIQTPPLGFTYYDVLRSLDLSGPHNFTLSGVISGTGGIEKREGNRVTLSNSANTFAGGVYLYGGSIEFASNAAAGTGRLWLGYDYSTPSSAAATDGPATSALVSGGPTAIFTTAAPVINGLGGDRSDALVLLATNSNLEIRQTGFSEFGGQIAGVDTVVSGSPVPNTNNAKVTKTGLGTLVLSGTNSYSGGTAVANGALIFANAQALPTAGLLSSTTTGYLGYAGNLQLGDGSRAFTDAAAVTAYLNRFDKANTTGTLGFDNDGPHFLLNQPLALTGFNAAARLGSATHLLIDANGVITPQGTAYRFGGGGGYVEVFSPLTNDGATPRSLVVDSPSTSPLKVRAAAAPAANTYSGGMTVTQSALVFATGAMPAAGNFTVGNGGYVGTEDASLAIATYLARFNPAFPSGAATSGTIGFDAAPGSGRTISGAIDLTTGTVFTGNVNLGTSSPSFWDGTQYQPGLTLSGPITPAGGATAPYRFAAYKGGTLNVASTLTGNRAVVIGDPTTIGLFGDPSSEQHSTVFLTGTNTHVGDTTLFAGRLSLGGSTAITSALGAEVNKLIVSAFTFPAGLLDEPVYPVLTSTRSDLVVNNPVTLNTTLELAGSFRLAGVISGASGLHLDDYNANVSLSGTNLFTGGIYVQSGRINLLGAQAAGLGTLGFGGFSDGLAFFGRVNPADTAAHTAIIKGLASNNDGARVQLEDNTTLRIEQNANTVYRGQFQNGTSVVTGSRLVKTGTGTLRLEGYGSGFTGSADTASGYTISADIQQGAVVIAPQASQPLGNGTIKVSGGTLGLDHATLYNNLLTVSGQLAGVGTFANGVTGGTRIATGMTLSPGYSGALAAPEASLVGRLTFDHLTLSTGGVYVWNLQNTGGTSVVHDLVTVNTTFNIDAAAAGFQIQLVSLLPDGSTGTLTNFVANQPFSFPLIHVNGLSSIASFDPGKFTLNSSLFSHNAGVGSLSLSQVAINGGTSIVLNFTPVPEPSTWALMISGLAAVAFTALRRRRRT